MRIDLLLTPEMAAQFHAAAARQGGVAWLVTRGTPDYPDRYVARPRGLRGGAPYMGVLVGRTLEEVRAELPPGLRRVERAELDRAELVESWV